MEALLPPASAADADAAAAEADVSTETSVSSSPLTSSVLSLRRYQCELLALPIGFASP